ncbi:MAG: hypothetical protein ACSHX4_07220 [Opitutaceae bacterium]
MSVTPGLAYMVEKNTDLAESNGWEIVDQVPLLPASPYDVHVETDAAEEKAFWRISLQD